jgi:pheromone a factor receptor
MIFSVGDLLLGIPIAGAYLYFNIREGIVPFPGLTHEHYQFSQVVPLPAVVWRATTISELIFELNRWITVWCSFVFFAIFGFTQESRDNYRAVLQRLTSFFMMLTGIRSRPISKAEGVAFKAATRELPVDSLDSDMGSSVV